MVPLHESSARRARVTRVGRLRWNQCSGGASPLRDGEQRRQARLRGEQVVGVRVLPRHPGVVADPEEFALGVVERPEVHLAHERIGALGEIAAGSEERREGSTCLSERCHVRRRLPGGGRCRIASPARDARLVEVGCHLWRQRLCARGQPRREGLDLSERPGRLRLQDADPVEKITGGLIGALGEVPSLSVQSSEPLVPRL